MKKVIYGAFKPSMTEDFRNEVTFEVDEVLKSERVMVTSDGEVTSGQKVLDYIKANPEKTFLVSFQIFDNRDKLGLSNVVKFDPAKSIYGKNGTIQGGLIFP